MTGFDQQMGFDPWVLLGMDCPITIEESKGPLVSIHRMEEDVRELEAIAPDSPATKVAREILERRKRLEGRP